MYDSCVLLFNQKNDKKMTRCAKKFALFDYVDWILGAYVLFIGSRKRENDNC